MKTKNVTEYKGNYQRHGITKRQDECYIKIDNAIREMNYEESIALCKESLNELYDYIIKLKMTNQNKVTTITNKASIIRDFLVNQNLIVDIWLPTTKFNLIEMFTSAIANADNNSALLNYNKKTAKCIAEFTRDSLKTISSFLIKLL